MKKNDLTAIQSAEAYLPGCYSHLRPKNNESLPGFLLRLAEANCYGDIKALLSAVLPAGKESLRPKIASIRLSTAHLERLGRVACGDANALSAFLAITLPNRALLIQGCRIPLHGFLPDGETVCPSCLAEDGYFHDEWEFSPVTVCPTHRFPLIDRCIHCGDRFTWNRRNLRYCHKCGSPVEASSPTLYGATAAECQLAEDFAALADFRIETAPGMVQVISWEEMLNIAQAISQSPAAWLSQELSRTKDFSRISLSQRRGALEAIANTRTDKATYQIHQLRTLIHKKMAVISHFLPEDYVAETAFTFLMQCEQLTSSTARALSGIPDIPSEGASLFNGRPPSYASCKEVSDFLKIDMMAYRYLRRHNYIPFHDPEESLGIDIDYLIRAKFYVEYRLAGLAELSKMIGLPVTWSDLNLFPVRLSWPAEIQRDKRIPFDDLRHVQLMLQDKISSMPRPVHPLKIGEIALASGKPLQCLASHMEALLNGRTKHCQWNFPYRWVDLAIESEEVGQ
jgi:hypothetical protein